MEATGESPVQASAASPRSPLNPRNDIWTPREHPVVVSGHWGRLCARAFQKMQDSVPRHARFHTFLHSNSTHGPAERNRYFFCSSLLTCERGVSIKPFLSYTSSQSILPDHGEDLLNLLCLAPGALVFQNLCCHLLQRVAFILTQQFAQLIIIRQ